ncbi:MAG: hypothetical protein AAFO07_12005, partial [Bacteroidota bacterium]
MKNLLIAFICFLPCAMWCQTTSGVITYEKKTNMWMGMDEEKLEQFKQYIPEYRTELMELIFDGPQSMYRAAKNNDTTNELNDGDKNIKVSFKSSDDQLYKNLEKGTV